MPVLSTHPTDGNDDDYECEITSKEALHHQLRGTETRAESRKTASSPDYAFSTENTLSEIDDSRKNHHIHLSNNPDSQPSTMDTTGRKCNLLFPTATTQESVIYYLHIETPTQTSKLNLHPRHIPSISNPFQKSLLH
jgi:hypothetical protein